ncbi:MAG TPA: AAA family ATPase [Candidatus Binatia bacterium]|nr:AAA family ATPase [Candidatus Binatia bacterium]
MYERFFGLADAPFRLTPDPRYLFLSRKHAEALAHLQLGLKESSGFVCITGDVGTGKTTLLRSFLRQLGPDIATAYVFNPPLTALELLKTINGELGLMTKTFSRKKLVDALNAHLLAQREAGRRSIVVIDEAQTLPIDVLEQLRLLSNLETTTEKLLRIVLVGQPQLRALLLHPELVQLNQRITLRWHMGPLAKGETATYIAHRLRIAAGGPPPRIFTRGAIARVHRISAGVPRLINMVAHRSMLAAFAADERVVTRRIVRQAYREIGALPLAASSSRRPRLVRVGWAAAGLAACVAIAAVGAARLGAWPDLRLVRANVPPVTDPPAVEPPPAEPAPVSDPTPPADPAPAADAAPGPAVAEAAPEPVPTPPAADAPPSEPAAPPTPAAAEPPATVVATAVAPAAPAVADPARPTLDVAARLAGVNATQSVRAAGDALFAAWHARPLDVREGPLPAAFTAAAQQRGLEYLPLVGNMSMLRLLDLPAILEFRIPGADGTRYATLVGVTATGALLDVGGAVVPVDTAFLDAHWFGTAHLVWRDFESLGRAFGREGRGAYVARLQGLLRKVGVYHGPLSGIFDTPTEAALLDFQRSRLLVPDGRVGRLTRIVLYAASGGYERPTLGASS